MRRARGPSVLLAAFVAVLVLAGPALAQTGQVGIRHIDTSKFPNVRLIVSIQGVTKPSPSDIRVQENGAPVRISSVTPLSSSGSVNVVLAVDTSDSMGGTKLDAALAAARSFVQAAAPQVRIGILTFAGKPTVLAPVGSSRSTELKILQSQATSGGTTLFDATVAASKMFPAAGERNLILLTDGFDTKSVVNLQQASAAARGAGVTIFSVGVGASPDTQSLEGLAKATAGVYQPASSGQLTGIYQQLAGELSSQYQIVYRSRAPGETQISVTVTTPQGTDTALARTPRTTPPPSKVTPVPHPILAGPLGLGLALGLSFLAVLLLAVVLAGGILQARRERVLARRFAAKAPRQSAAASEGESSLTGWMPESVVTAGEKVAEAGGFEANLDVKLERAGLPVRAGEFVVASALAATVAAILAGVLLQSLLFAAIGLVVGAVIPAVVLAILEKRRVGQLHSQLADVLMIIASSLRAGHSFMQALDMVSKDIPEPAAQEFSRVVAEIRLGRPVDEALGAMAERIGSDDYRWAFLAVNVQREVGGNLAEVLDTVAETVRERDTVRRQIDVLSAEGKLSARVLMVLPIVIALWMFKVNRQYFDLLFTTNDGRIMFGVGAGLMVIGYFWMRRIVKIDV